MSRAVVAKLRLLCVLLGFSSLFVFFGDAIARRAIELAEQRGLTLMTTDIYLFGFTYGLLFFLLATLPLLMMIAYQGMQAEAVRRKVAEDLTLCEVDADLLETRWQEYAERNSPAAHFLPMLLNVLLLYLVWATLLFPEGLSGVVDRMQSPGQATIGLASILPRVAAEASAVSWTLLGVYFYSIGVLIRRWLESDLTTAVIWWIDVRLILGFVLGMLLSVISTANELASLGPWLSGFAFFCGIIPDALLRRLPGLAKGLTGAGPSDAGKLSIGGDLRRWIPGMSFWQADRLAEEGIETVEELASKDIASLLVRTRIDTALLFTWVDRALLCDAAREDVDWFDRAHILRATDLMARASGPGGIDSLLQSLTDARQRAPSASESRAGETRDRAPSREVLENVLASLSNDPNLRLMRTYCHNKHRWLGSAVPDDQARCAGAGDGNNPGGAAPGDRELAGFAPQILSTAANAQRHPYARVPLTTILLLLAVFFPGAGHWIGSYAVIEASQRGWPLVQTDIYAFAFNTTLAFFLLISLPLLLVLGYRGLKSGVARADLRHALHRCGLAPRLVETRIEIFEHTQNMWAHLLPLLVNLALLGITWSMVMLPTGIQGLLEVMRASAGDSGVPIPEMLTAAAKSASPLVWIMLGAYFHAAMVLVNHWRRTDLSSQVIWRINARFVSAFVVGLLVMEIFDVAERSLSDLRPTLSAFAFLCGMVPDMALRWISLRLRRLGGISDADAAQLAASDLRRGIPGMTFWQQDRLLEAGVESVSDLARIDAPDMICRVGQDPELLIRWIDHAMLSEQTGAALPLFRRAHLDRASTLVIAAETPQADQRIIGSLGSGPDQPPTLTRAVLENILSGLRGRINLLHVRAFQSLGDNAGDDEPTEQGRPPPG